MFANKEKIFTGVLTMALSQNDIRNIALVAHVLAVLFAYAANHAVGTVKHLRIGEHPLETPLVVVHTAVTECNTIELPDVHIGTSRDSGKRGMATVITLSAGMRSQVVSQHATNTLLTV